MFSYDSRPHPSYIVRCHDCLFVLIVSLVCHSCVVDIVVAFVILSFFHCHGLSSYYIVFDIIRLCYAIRLCVPLSFYYYLLLLSVCFSCSLSLFVILFYLIHSFQNMVFSLTLSSPSTIDSLTNRYHLFMQHIYT